MVDLILGFGWLIGGAGAIVLFFTSTLTPAERTERSPDVALDVGCEALCSIPGPARMQADAANAVD